MTRRDPMSLRTMPERLAALYVAAGYTRASFATAVPIPAITLERWEQFEDVPLLVELGEVANKLHVSKRALCFGNRELQVGKRGEEALNDASIQLVLNEMDATQAEREALALHRRRVAADLEYSRTFVLTFVNAWRAGRSSGCDDETAATRAMVVATQAHVLSRAVAQGVRPVRKHQLKQPPKGLSEQEAAEWMAQELHSLAGMKPPIDAMVLAVACGHRLVPTYGESTGSKSASLRNTETSRQDDLGWAPLASVDGNDLVLNGVLRITVYPITQEQADNMLQQVQTSFGKLGSHADEPSREPLFAMAFIVSRTSRQLMIARPTEDGLEPPQQWVRPALRDLMRRSQGDEIYILSIGLASPSPSGPSALRKACFIDLADSRTQHKKTYVATQRSSKGELEPWSEASLAGPFADVIAFTQTSA